MPRHRGIMPTSTQPRSEIRYVYVMKEGGSGVFVIPDEPTTGDVENVQVGLLEIIRLSDMAYMDRDGRWCLLKAGVLFQTPAGVGAAVHLPSNYG